MGYILYFLLMDFDLYASQKLQNAFTKSINKKRNVKFVPFMRPKLKNIIRKPYIPKDPLKELLEAQMKYYNGEIQDNGFEVDDGFDINEWQEKVNEMEKDDECPICGDDMPVGPDIVTLNCRHRFHDECLTEWGKYKDNDFVNDKKHKCPTCRQGVILLNPNDPYHYHLMDHKTLWLKTEFLENDKLPAKEIEVYRFCLKCKKTFVAGTKSCHTDDNDLPFYCMKCDPIKRTRPCPGCGISITWANGCQRMTCTKCRVNFCFIHMKTEKQIRDELKIIAKKEPEFYSSINDGMGGVYSCPDCWRQKIAYSQGGRFDDVIDLDELQKGNVIKVTEKFSV